MNELSRRQFLAAAGAAAILPVAGKAAQATGAGQKIRVGIIGTGGRGTNTISKLMAAHGGYEIYAGADYFQDRVDAWGEKFGVPAERRFTTLSGYKRLLDLKEVDAVAIISPPYFHPQQTADALAAGKHVYLAKPIAVDVPGCQSIAESGKKATADKKVMLVDFQTRANPFYQEAIKRVHAGAIGTLSYGQSMYHTGRLNRMADSQTGAERRLREWVFDIPLSGDIIVEQNIHTLDVMNWVMQAPPLSCTGTGGRKGRVDVGDCWDHYACLYEYADGVGFTFSSRQYDGEGDPAMEGIILNTYGSKGALMTRYGGRVAIRGGKGASYAGGDTKPIYQEGAATNIDTFHKAVFAGDFTNTTVAPSVQSNLVSVMGRTATRLKRTVTWQEMMEFAEKIEADLSGLKA